MPRQTFRIEHDSLGKLKVPAEALWGVETQRAVENFPVSGLRAHPALIRAIATVKAAAALANMERGKLDKTRGRAIYRAASEIVEGKHHDAFVIDVYQAGAGTSFNMNANEVIANLALEILGKPRGHYKEVHPHDHVNMAQSTNDVFPTSMRLAALELFGPTLESVEEARRALAKKGKEFYGTVKSGRTHLQDAVPIRLGQEFGAYAENLSGHLKDLHRAQEGLRDLGIGATAVGTSLNAGPQYTRLVVKYIRQLSGQKVRSAPNLVEKTQSLADFVRAAAALKGLAVDLIRIANDLRLLSSGPRTGFYEITLPAVQPGSSIMPGKINPVMAEMMDMVGFQIIGNELTITMAAQAGQMELNVMMPVVAHNLLWSLEITKGGVAAFARRCVRGIAANHQRCKEWSEASLALATALSPKIGYEAAAKISQEAFHTGKTVWEVASVKKIMSDEELDKILDPALQVPPGCEKGKR